MSESKLREWLNSLHDQPHLDLLTKACTFALHQTQELTSPVRESLIDKGLGIAHHLKNLQSDADTLAAGLIYPVFIHSSITSDSLEKDVSEVVSKLVRDVKRMQVIDNLPLHLKSFSLQKNVIDNLRKLLLAMVDDIRIVLIKLAERLVTLQLLKEKSPNEQIQIAQRAMDLYAPLANRLGIGQFKWLLEDLSFRYLDPENYKSISKSLNMRRIEREKYIQDIIQELSQRVSRVSEAIKITGRPKHIYSIYRKIQRKDVDISQIYDTSAVRILVPTIEDCYTVLGIVHTQWEPISHEFDDYIVKPKPNGYRSIHTAVIGPNGHPLEIQIRTHHMNEESELGVAAHWKYKEGKNAVNYEDKIHLLREVMNWQKEVAHEGSREEVYQKIFGDRVYVFTPEGDVIDLPLGATPVDFAYSIHTNVGHRCRGAKINEVMVPLTYHLKTGDRVEIITVKSGNPSRDWLNPNLGYLATRSARAKVSHWFRQQSRAEHIEAGKLLWDKSYAKAGLSKNAIQKIYSEFNFDNLDDLYAAIGSGMIGIHTLINRIASLESPQPVIKESETFTHKTAPFRRDQHSHVVVEGVENVLTQLARCCHPIPGDPIVGYVTKIRGVSVHHRNCRNIQQTLAIRPSRIIEAKWIVGLPKNYPVDLYLEANDRPGLLRDISAIIANEHITILGLTSRIDKLFNRSTIHATLEVSNLEMLDKIIKNLQSIPEVTLVKRKM